MVMYTIDMILIHINYLNKVERDLVVASRYRHCCNTNNLAVALRLQQPHNSVFYY